MSEVGKRKHFQSDLNKALIFGASISTGSLHVLVYGADASSSCHLDIAPRSADEWTSLHFCPSSTPTDTGDKPYIFHVKFAGFYEIKFPSSFRQNTIQEKVKHSTIWQMA